MLKISEEKNSSVGLPARSLLLDDAVDDRAEDADRREAAGGRAVDDHQAHQDRVDLVADGEAERDRRDDRHRRGDDRADRGQHRGDREHHPRDQRDAPADRAHRGVHEPVDGAVVVRDREQVGDADQDDEQVAREAGEDVVLGDPDGAADDERGGDAEQAHVDRAQRADGEDRHEDEYRCDFLVHPSLSLTRECLSDELHRVARRAAGPVRDLLAAGDARGGDQRRRGLLPDRREQAHPADAHATARSARPRSRTSPPCRSSRRRARRPRRRGSAPAARRSRRCPRAPSGGSGRGTGSAAGRGPCSRSAPSSIASTSSSSTSLVRAATPRSPSSCTCSSRSVSRHEGSTPVIVAVPGQALGQRLGLGARVVEQALGDRRAPAAAAALEPHVVARGVEQLDRGAARRPAR